jgi:glutaryl-CoA dehydrogenase
MLAKLRPHIKSFSVHKNLFNPMGKRSKYSFAIQGQANFTDPFDLHSQLTPEEREIQEVARDYARTHLQPRIRSAYQEELFDREILREMGSLGFLGCDLTYGDRESVGPVASGLITREIERIDSGYRSAMSVQSSLVMYCLHRFGSSSQQERWLPLLSTGDVIGCFGLTEPNHGSDPSGMETRARSTGGESESGWILNGSKTWITNAPIAHVALVWAKDDLGGVGAFIVEREREGFETPVITHKGSLRASATGMLMLDNVHLPRENRLPKAKGIGAALACLNKARYGIAWGSLGAAESCYEIATQYVLDRSQFGRPLAATQLVQVELAEMITELSLGWQSVLRVGRMLETGSVSPATISLVKRNSTTKALQIARRARDLLGGNGISLEYDIIRHLMNLESVVTYEGTKNIHALIMGRAITGLQAFKP